MLWIRRFMNQMSTLENKSDFQTQHLSYCWNSTVISKHQYPLSLWNGIYKRMCLCILNKTVQWHNTNEHIPVLVRHLSAFFLNRRSCFFSGPFVATTAAVVTSTAYLLLGALSSITAASQRRYNWMYSCIKLKKNRIKIIGFC